MIRPAFTALVLAAVTLCAAASPSLAKARPSGGILGYVTATSHFGNGSIKAPYRATSVGYQIRLPHGTWVYCRTSCSETLRVETVDIWDAVIDNGSPIGAGTMQAECGVLGCLTWSRTLPF
jgi:hypothetical protein